ncbi:MAG: hypothetical protein LBH65_05165 [Desulfovibrio sp.]|jgi:hypothetical protein|nr:hypothetical protein [Desulfovibrio sp.]
MPLKHCLIHANCQGGQLERYLLASPDFRRAFRVARRTNYLREAVSDEEIGGCDLFLYQELGEQWGDLASEKLLKRLSPSAVAVRIPNLFFKGYWPFWTTNSPFVEFGDVLLDRLLAEGAPKTAIMRIYLHTDIQAYVNLQEIFEKTIAFERRKEENTAIKTVDYLIEHWKSRRLFHTHNHPGRELLALVAQDILRMLDLPGLRRDHLRDADNKPDEEAYAVMDLPIHPQVGAFFNLPFAGPETQYNVYGRRMTFAGYISRYIDCRMNGLEKDFIGYLQLV